MPPAVRTKVETLREALERICSEDPNHRGWLLDNRAMETIAREALAAAEVAPSETEVVLSEIRDCIGALDAFDGMVPRGSVFLALKAAALNARGSKR